MANLPAPFITIESSAARRFESSAELPTIKILLYTDDPRVKKGAGAPWGFGLMLNHLQAHAPAFARLSFTYLNRNEDPSNKLYCETIKDFDQIWFFGVHQVSRDNFSLGFLRGGPDSELEEEEVTALEKWMCANKENDFKAGGVLMTGDHADRKPTDAKATDEGVRCHPDAKTDSKKEEFLGLGRALGRCVPRAGLLRKWEGPPTARKKDSFNTQVLVFGTDPDNSGLQRDTTPQQLILRTFNHKGKPSRAGQPHPLFFYRQGLAIQVFPDHMHEGAVIIPKCLDETVWPKIKGRQPKPRVVAYGIDKRNARRLKLVAAYNGDGTNAGRIVADSTWHHYFNVNLNSFLAPGEQDSFANQIGQYYANLALWLSPRSRRHEMARAMLDLLAHDPVILEEVIGYKFPEGDEHQQIADALQIGATAFNTLSELASPCEIHELLQALIPEDYSEYFETLYLPDKCSGMSYLPSKEMFLGCLITLYCGQMVKVESSGLVAAAAQRKSVIVDTAERAFMVTLKLHAKRLALAATVAQSFFDSLR